MGGEQSLFAKGINLTDVDPDSIKYIIESTKETNPILFQEILNCAKQTEETCTRSKCHETKFPEYRCIHPLWSVAKRDYELPLYLKAYDGVSISDIKENKRFLSKVMDEQDYLAKHYLERYREMISCPLAKDEKNCESKTNCRWMSNTQNPSQKLCLYDPYILRCSLANHRYIPETMPDPLKEECLKIPGWRVGGR